MVQIGCYMYDAEAEELTTYASLLELTRPALCALIIQRELREPKLRPSVAKRDKVSAARGRRVTVNLGNVALKDAFTAHVRALGFGSDEAAAALFRQELAERSLWYMFGLKLNRS